MKINVKKLNQYMMSSSNHDAMKSFVEACVQAVLNEKEPNDQQIIFLRDLGLLSE